MPIATYTLALAAVCSLARMPEPLPRYVGLSASWEVGTADLPLTHPLNSSNWQAFIRFFLKYLLRALLESHGWRPSGQGRQMRSLIC